MAANGGKEAIIGRLDPKTSEVREYPLARGAVVEMAVLATVEFRGRSQYDALTEDREPCRARRPVASQPFRNRSTRSWRNNPCAS